VLQRFAAVIFDMDGVLIDSEPIHFDVLRALLRQDGFELSQAENEDFIGVTSEAMFTTLIARHGLPRGLADYMARYDQAVLRAFDQPRSPQPGVVSLLETLRANAVPTAVASSSRRAWIDATLRSLGLATAFDAIVSGDDVARSKPDPAIYLLAAQRLEVPPERCLAIEDSPNGVESARRAGMAVVGVRTASTAHLQLDGVLATVDSVAEIG
jgi:HAD superfamily hydrolase (TIGR01509 family)